TEHTDYMAPGSPLSTSTQAINPSWTPRFFSSVKTESQHFAPSLSLSHNPRSAFSPSMVMPSARETALVCTGPSCRDFTNRASKYRIGYTEASGRDCQVRTSSKTASVVVEITVLDSSVPYS